MNLYSPLRLVSLTTLRTLNRKDEIYNDTQSLPRSPLELYLRGSQISQEEGKVTVLFHVSTTLVNGVIPLFSPLDRRR